jgi:hypothetical protein
VLGFLTTNHDFYAANKLVRQSMGDGNDEKRSGNLLKLSYGQRQSADSSSGSGLIQDGKIVVSVDGFVFFCLLVMGLFFSIMKRRYEHDKEN